MRSILRLFGSALQFVSYSAFVGLYVYWIFTPLWWMVPAIGFGAFVGTVLRRKYHDPWEEIPS